MKAQTKTKKLIFSALILLSFGMETILSLGPLPQTPAKLIFLNDTQLALNKIKAAAKNLTSAEKTHIDQQSRWCLGSISPWPSVMLKTLLPGSGDIHDYYSMAPYLWPNMSLPYPHEPYYSRDGYVNPEILNVTDSSLKSNSLQSSLTCINAYLMTGNETYANVTLSLIRTWYIDSATKMNPHLKYSQIQKGKANNTDGTGTGIMDFYPLWNIFDMITVLKKTTLFTIEDNIALTNWFSSMLNYYLNSTQGRGVQNFKNNHKTYYNLNVIAMANFLNKPDIWNNYLSNTLTLMDSQIANDGNMPEEASRANSFHYFIFTLQAYLITAQIAKNLKYPVNFYTYQAPKGGSIKKTLDLLIKYATVPGSMPGSNISSINPSDLFKSLIMFGVNSDPYYLTVASKNGWVGFDTEYAYFNTTGTLKTF